MEFDVDQWLKAKKIQEIFGLPSQAEGESDILIRDLIWLIDKQREDELIGTCRF